MTDIRRREMKDYKEKAMAYEQRLKGKRISLDSGVMIASTEMQKLENYELPINLPTEPIFSDINNIKQIISQNKMETDSSVSLETPTLVSEKEEHNDSSSNKESISIKSDNVSLIKNSCETLIPKQELSKHLIVSNSTTYTRNNLDNGSPDTGTISITSETISLFDNNSCDSLASKQIPPQLLNVIDPTIHEEDNNTSKQIPRLRSNSYTLSSPSPIMVAFLNSQVQQQLIEPKSLENNINHLKESKSKSEPPSVFMTNDTDDKILMVKSNSFHSVLESCHNQALMENLVKYKYPAIINEQTDNQIITDPKHDDRGSVTTIGTNFSNDGSVGSKSIVTVFNGNNYENNSNPNSVTCSKSMKHCCCRYSDDEYSLCSNNIHYKTPEELNMEAERLRKTKLDIENRHQEELSNLIKKQKEEQEQIAVKYYLISQSISGKSLDDSEYSESFSKQQKTCSSSISFRSGMTATYDNSLLSDMSSIISNCSVNKNLVSSSPRQKTPSRSPQIKQNIKFFHRIRSSMAAKWTKAPDDVENSAATIINAGVRGYLTRRLLRTEKAHMLKKTILDSLKTALMMHLELKKQQPTVSDLELHQRIINQV